MRDGRFILKGTTTVCAQLSTASYPRRRKQAPIRGLALCPVAFAPRYWHVTGAHAKCAARPPPTLGTMGGV